MARSLPTLRKRNDGSARTWPIVHGLRNRRNDGYLLQYFKADRIPCFGVEPTSSTAKAARAKGIEIVEAFFGRDLATTLVDEGRSADLTAANNVLAHVPDINDFVGGFAILLKADGVSTFEFPHLMEMVQNNQFDTAYHEHYSYLSLTAVSKIFTANGLTVFDVETLPTHGGSLRVFAQRSDEGRRSIEASVAQMLDAESKAGLKTPDYYRAFQGRAERIKDDAVAFLIEAKQNGKRSALTARPPRATRSSISPASERTCFPMWSIETRPSRVSTSPEAAFRSSRKVVCRRSGPISSSSCPGISRTNWRSNSIMSTGGEESS